MIYHGEYVSSDNPDDLSAYGDIIFEIDVSAMKKDGYMPTVTKEEPIEEAELREKMAYIIGIEDYNAKEELHSDGIWESTSIIHGKIPSKYLKICQDIV